METDLVDTNLEYYHCPPGYCRCTILDGLSDNVCNNIYYHYDDDDQCVCDRKGHVDIVSYVDVYN